MLRGRLQLLLLGKKLFVAMIGWLILAVLLWQCLHRSSAIQWRSSLVKVDDVLPTHVSNVENCFDGSYSAKHR